MCIPIMKGNFCASFTYKQKMHPLGIGIFRTFYSPKRYERHGQAIKESVIL